MKNKILKAGIIMMVLVVAVLAMSGAGAAELVDLTDGSVGSITLTYYKYDSTDDEYSTLKESLVPQ